jgi:hypothetical protein
MTCVDCGDRMIHLLNRGPDESSSALGQFVHDELPRVMNAVDTDLALHARSTKIFRHIEHKIPGQDLSRAQRDVLPLYAEAVAALVARGRLGQQSGAFKMTWTLEIDTPAVVRRINYDGSWGIEYRLSQDALIDFLTARPVVRDLRWSR